MGLKSDNKKGGIYMQRDKIDTNLEYRKIQREEDVDYFIETLSYPIRFELPLPYMSRIQFPKSRAVLVRTSPRTTCVTIHIMRDVDLYSSFANFEIELDGRQLSVQKEEGYIVMTISP